MRPRILLVAGARPNFMKVAPVLRELDRREKSDNILLHTGQHYDANMSSAFFQDLGMREPDIHLDVGSGSHGWQTAEVLARTEAVLQNDDWAMVVVVGDVNSTVAAALAAAKMHIPVAHVEAGLRSGDRRMPEELNRIVTDQLSDLCLTTSRDGDDNLRAEGFSEERIVFAGNVMIDSLLETLEQVKGRPGPIPDLKPKDYAVVTLHRPSNVDDGRRLREIMDGLETIARDVRVVFPAHPRTARALEREGIGLDRVQLLPPLPYRDMVALQADAGLVLTDSGGIQEETTVLGVPCLTLRSSTERPITIQQGTNTLVPTRSRDAIVTAFRRAWGREVDPQSLEGWDGRASVRIVDAIHAKLERPDHAHLSE